MPSSPMPSIIGAQPATTAIPLCTCAASSRQSFNEPSGGPMNVRAHMSMLFHLDKCIGCHTCSIACKNIWTDRRGTEYMWWNNVETRPGTGYPTQWENQERFNGGWTWDGQNLRLRLHSRLSGLMKLFLNPSLPELE